MTRRHHRFHAGLLQAEPATPAGAEASQTEKNAPEVQPAPAPPLPATLELVVWRSRKEGLNSPLYVQAHRPGVVPTTVADLCFVRLVSGREGLRLRRGLVVNARHVAGQVWEQVP